MQKIVLWILLLLICSPGPNPVSAAGREKPHKETSQPLLVISWFQGGTVHVAAANTTLAEQSVTVALGSEGVQTELFSSQSFSVPARSIALVHFPLRGDRTEQGAQKAANFIYLYTAGGALIEAQPLQQAAGLVSSATLEKYHAPVGGGLVVNYTLPSRQGVRILFIPLSLPAAGAAPVPGRARGGFLKNCTDEDLSRLKLPDEYGKRARAMLADHIGYIVKAGEPARISVYYPAPAIKDCAVVRMTDYQYFFTPGGSVRHGRGQVPAVMIYDPAVMKLLPSQQLVLKENETGKQGR